MYTLELEHQYLKKKFIHMLIPLEKRNDLKSFLSPIIGPYDFTRNEFVSDLETDLKIFGYVDLVVHVVLILKRFGVYTYSVKRPYINFFMPIAGYISHMDNGTHQLLLSDNIDKMHTQSLIMQKYVASKLIEIKSQLYTLLHLYTLFYIQFEQSQLDALTPLQQLQSVRLLLRNLFRYSLQRSKTIIAVRKEKERRERKRKRKKKDTPVEEG